MVNSFDAGAAGDARGVDGAADSATTEVAAPVDLAPAVEQVPPQGKTALDAWLRAGHYKSWKCEVGIQQPRPRGVHGPNRVCSNDKLSAHAGPAPYPVGAATVKEIFYGQRVGNYAVAIKVKEGMGGGTWYWYEPGDMEGVGAPGCIGCHGMVGQYGGRDYIFVQVK